MSDGDNCDPATRYRAFGEFDAAAYEDDIRDYPQCFDENGWPLFGKFDALTLVHPITARPWYEQPRLPDRDEEGGEYLFWYIIALEFMDATTVIGRAVGHEAHLTEGPYLNQGDTLYTGQGSIEAGLSNINYLRIEILPRLVSLLRDRALTAEFTFLWGEFNKAIQILALACWRAKLGEQSGPSGGEGKKGQVKWYLHWREHYKNCGKSSIEANRDFLKVAREILEGKIALPAGFDQEWFTSLRLRTGCAVPPVWLSKLGVPGQHCHRTDAKILKSRFTPSKWGISHNNRPT